MNKISKEKLLLIKRSLCMLLVVTLLTPTQVSNGNVVHAASNTTQVTIANFEGSWQASDYALGKPESTNHWGMTVDKDGRFNIYDQIGNPGISGKMTVVDEETIKLECESYDFFSPWPGLQLTDELEYHFYSDNQVRITYKDHSIVFSIREKRFTIENESCQDDYRVVRCLKIT